MSSLNKAMVIGRLGGDPQVRYTQSNVAVANFSIATSEYYKDSNGEKVEKTTWHKIVAWGRTAEICQEYLKKGSLVYIEGSLQTRDWEDRDGVKRYTTEIKCLKLQMLDTRISNGSGDNNGQKQGSRPKSSGQPGGSKVVELDDTFDNLDDDLPF